MSSPGVQTAQGENIALDQLSGEWHLIQRETGVCDVACQERIAALARIDTALVPRAEQVNYFVLVDERLPDELFARKDIFQLLAADNTALLEALEKVDQADSLADGERFIVNLGYVMMHYDESQDGYAPMKDLQRLVKADGRETAHDDG